MSDILNKIVLKKRDEIAEQKQKTPESELLSQLKDAPDIRNFVVALKNANPIGLIAEIKKASPSAGLIRDDFNPVEIAKIYESHGAACISVLTDEHFFKGSLEYLKQVREVAQIPLLRKDFILDRFQITQARAAGADAVLLIAECLNDDELHSLYEYAGELGMTSLIEIYEPSNLERVLKLSPPLMGVNNRNLRTFVTSLDHTLELQKSIPEETLLVSESGIQTGEDVQKLVDAGIGAILVGETLMRPDDIGKKVDEILLKN